jgi:hypothetical protein
MRKLKRKLRKKDKPVRVIRRIKIKPKLGRWCQYYEGRLPYPIECQSNTDPALHQKRPFCRKCKRVVEWEPWKKGVWDKIKEAIKNGEDLQDMEAPKQ